MVAFIGPPVIKDQSLSERVRVFVAEARGQSGGIGQQVSEFAQGQHVHRSAPYTPKEVSRGPSIFPAPGSTNSNFPPRPSRDEIIALLRSGRGQ